MYSLVLAAALDPNECIREEICMTKRILSTIIAILSLFVYPILPGYHDIWENPD